MKPVDSGQWIVDRKQDAPGASPLATGHLPLATAVVIGYGNPLRSDDGFGWHASRLLAQRLSGQDIEVITCHQLTPELAERLSHCTLAVFLDADCKGKPGEIHSRELLPEGLPPQAFTHTCTPAGLLASAEKLYGHRPRAFAITVTAQTFEFGESLSPVVAATLPNAVEQVCRTLAMVAGRNVSSP